MKLDPVAEQIHNVYSQLPFPNKTDEGIRRTQTDFEETLKHLGLGEEDVVGRAVLDAGCGTGVISALMASRFNAHVTAVDLSGPSMTIARENASRTGRADHIEFVRASLMDLDLPKKDYDLIICKDVLNHVQDPERCLRRLAAHLRPGGTLIFRVGAFWPWLFDNATIPYWKLLILRRLFPDASRRVAAARALRWGSPYVVNTLGVPLETHLWDAFGTDRFDAFTYGRVLRWVRRGGLQFEASDPPMALRTLIDEALEITSPKRVSATGRNAGLRRFARGLLTALPLHRAGVFSRPSVLSRGLVQALHVTVLRGAGHIAVRAIKHVHSHGTC